MKIEKFEIKEEKLSNRFMLYEVDSQGVWVTKGLLTQHQVLGFRQEMEEQSELFLKEMEIMSMLEGTFKDLYKSTYVIIPIQSDVQIFTRSPITKD